MHITMFFCNFAKKIAFMKKKTYIKGFFSVVALLSLTRLVWPEVAEGNGDYAKQAEDSAAVVELTRPAMAEKPMQRSRYFKQDGSLVKNRIFSVPSFKNTFPDMNDVQMVAAKKNGVSPVKNREEAESRMKELVFVGTNPYLHVDRLNNSIPYLVPQASALLQDIGSAFFDSLQIKGIPLHKIIVTSVMRTKDDVTKLRVRNANATENSCHLYGTTFDLCYNRYITVEDPEGPKRRAVRNDTLKWILSEVLRDFRQQNRCFIKYEVKQGCFHMTVN